MAKNTQKQKELEEQINELSVKINNLRTEINEVNNSNSNDKIKKLQDDLEVIEQRLGDTEKASGKVADDLQVLRSELKAL